MTTANESPVSIVKEEILKLLKPVTTAQATHDEHITALGELSPRLAEVRAFCDPSDQKVVQRIVIEDLTLSKMIEFHERFAAKAKEELGEARHELSYWGTEKSKMLTPLLSCIADENRIARREKLAAAYPAAAAIELDRLVAAHADTVREDAFIQSVSRGIGSPEDTLKLCQLLIEGKASPFSFQFAPSDGINNFDWSNAFLARKS